MASLKARLPQIVGGPPSSASLADGDRVRQFSVAITATIDQICNRTGAAPPDIRVLHVGGGAYGALPMASIKAGATVMVVDPDKRVCKEVHDNCASAAAPGQLTIETVHSMRHVTDHKYDLVVCDAFGPTITDKGFFACAYDLRARGLLRAYPAFDSEPLFIPSEATMLLTVYHCPAFSVRNWAMHMNPCTSTLFMHMSAPPKTEDPKDKPTQLKFQHDSGSSGVRFDKGVCTPVCAPVCVATARFGSRENALVREDGGVIHVDVSQLDPSQHMAPAHSYVALLEWGLELIPFPEHERRGPAAQVTMVGNAINLLTNISPADKLARWACWGHSYTVMPQPVDPTIPLRVSTAFKTNGDVSITLTPIEEGDDPTETIETIPFTETKLAKLCEKMFLAC